MVSRAKSSRTRKWKQTREGSAALDAALDAKSAAAAHRWSLLARVVQERCLEQKDVTVRRGLRVDWKARMTSNGMVG